MSVDELSWLPGRLDLAFHLDGWLAASARRWSETCAVLAHPQRRWWPLLESVATVAWLHVQDDPLRDFHATPGCQPALRPRLSLAAGEQASHEAAAMLHRAQLRVLAVTDDAASLSALIDLGGWSDAVGETLLWGREDALAWADSRAFIQALGLADLRAPSGWRCVASPGLRHTWHAVPQWGSGTMAASWAQRAPLRQRQAPDPAWQLQLPGCEALAASSELAQQRTMVWGRALMDRRGNFSLIRPWDGALLWRALLPNVRVRVAEVPLYLPGGTHITARAHWQGQALRLQAALPALQADQPAWMHGAMPAYALPDKDFCELAMLAWESMA